MNSPDARPRRSARFFAGPGPAVALALVCFANTAFNDFTYDDKSIVKNNPRIRSLTAFHDIWLRDWWYGDVDGDPIVDPARDRLYRPLTLHSFAVNYAVDGLRPLGYHVVNVLLHALSCYLVWLFARRLCEDDAVASLAAVLFAAHPVHCEAVAGIVGRAEILAAVFLLSGLLALIPRRGLPSAGRGLLAALAFLAALLSKETAVCYPAIAVIGLLFARDLKPTSWHWRIGQTGCLLAPLAVYFPLRYAALEQHLIRNELAALIFAPLQNANVWERVQGAFTVLGHYARLLLAPRKLSCDYGMAVFDPQAGPELMTLAGLLAAVVLITVLFRIRAGQRQRRLLGVLSAMFLASYVLVSNTFLLIGVSIAERLMYWPSVPILIAAAALIIAGYRKHCGVNGTLRPRANLLQVLGVALLAAIALRSVVRNGDWHDDETLFRADLATFPRSAHLNCSLAQIDLLATERATAPQQRAALISETEALLSRAIEIEPRYPEALRRLGIVHLLRDDRERALEYFNSALLLNPSDKTAARHAAALRDGAEALQVAADELARRVEAAPEDARLRVELAEKLIALGRNYEALRQCEQAVGCAPSDAVVLRAYGEALALNLQREQALEVFRRVLSLDERDWRTHANISGLLADRDAAGALRHAEIAFNLQPDDLHTRINLAEALALNGRTSEAIAQFRQIERGLSVSDPLRPSIADRIRELQR